MRHKVLLLIYDNFLKVKAVHLVKRVILHIVVFKYRPHVPNFDISRKKNIIFHLSEIIEINIL